MNKFKLQDRDEDGKLYGSFGYGVSLWDVVVMGSLLSVPLAIRLISMLLK